jgi:Zn ribbon nucleic-acid-binding protein
MSRFIQHEPCPKCGSRDNVGVWEDGHKYCFGCGYYYNGNRSLQDRVKSMKKTEVSQVSLPPDCDTYIPATPSEWLSSFGITKQEIIDNRILWSEHRNYLCFPYFGEDNQLVAYQARYFGKSKDHPKWITYGKINEYIKIFNLTDAREKGILLVEDIISAIKIGRQYPVSPLFGSFVDWGALARYWRYTGKIILWLDSDKYKDARKFEARASLLGFDARVIFTEKDPKCYSDTDINKYIEYIYK